MKRLIISRLNSNPYDTGLNKIIEQWESGQSIIVVPPEYVVEVVEDGRNEAAIWLDHEIEKRKAAVSKTASPTEEIKVGDVVRHFNSLGIVVKANKYHVCVLTIDRNYITVDKMNLEKTGSNFTQIEEILEQIENENRQSKN